jgi:hypothetical protein
MHPLESQIRAVGRWAYRLWLWYGLARFVTTVATVGLGLVLLDWLVRYDDAGVRMIATVAFAAAAGWAIMRYLAPVLTSGLGEVAVAQRIERRFPALSDRLSNTMAFLSQSEAEPTAGSADLRRSVVAETTAALEDFDLSAAIDVKPARRAAAVMLGVVIMAVGLAAADREAARIGVARLFNPVGDATWPRRNHLEFETPLTRLASGATFEVSLLDRHGHLPQDVRIEYRYEGEDQPHLIEPMLRRGQRMVARRENVTRGFFYRAVGGDDTSMAEIRLEVAQPPRITSITLTLIPPAYTGWKPYSADGAIHAIKKTHVAVMAHVDKPLSKAAVLLEGGRGSTELAEVRVVATLSAGNLGFEISPTSKQGWEIDDARWYGFELVGLDGVAMPGDDVARWEIRPVVDHPPTVTLVEPSENLYVTPQAKAPIRVLAKDDVAIRRVALQVRPGTPSKGAPTTIGLFSGGDRIEPAAAGSLEKPGPLADLAPPMHELDLATLNAAPGDVLELSAAAEDYQPATGTSPPRRVFVLSPSQFEDRLAERQSRILGDLARALAQQQQAATQTTAIQSGTAALSRLGKGDLDAIATLRHGQRQVTRLLTAPNDGVIAQTENLLREMRNNRLDASPSAERWRALAAELTRLNRSHLADLDHRLLTLADRAQTAVASSAAAVPMPEVRGSLADVARLQAETIAALQKLSDRLTEIDGVRRLSREVDSLHKTQAGLARRAAELAAAILGKATADLTAEEQAELARLAKAQLDAAAQLDKIEARMAPLAQRLRSSDGRTASTLEQAHESLRQEGLAGQMREASRQLAVNRVGQAGEQQAKIADSLGKLSDLLAARQEHDPKGLVKKLRAARQELDRTAAEQEGLRKKATAARKSGDATRRDELARLARRQRELAQQAERLARELRRLEAQRAAASLDQAAQKMQTAADLDKKAGSGGDQQAESAQTDAAASLRRAQQDLADELQTKELDLLREQQARLEDALAGIIARQENVRRQTGIHDTARSGLSKKPAEPQQAWKLAVADLAREQNQLQDEATRLAGDLENAEVAVLALRHVADEMKRAADALAREQTGAPAQRAQDNALTRLAQLLNATKSSPPPDLDNTAEPEPKKDPDGPDQPDKNRPPRMLSELRLLVAMQQEINRRTQALEQTRKPDAALTAEQQTEYDQLATEQGEVAELLLKLTRPAGQAPNQPGKNDDSPKAN